MPLLNCKEYTDKLTSVLQKNNPAVCHPKLTIIANKEDEASKVYVKNKMLKCMEVGISCEVIYPITSEHNYQKAIQDTQNPLIVQLPLPNNLKEHQSEILRLIPKHFDADGLIGGNIPCTPQGIVDFLEYSNYDFNGKNAVVIGRSNIVGRPMAKLLTDRNCTVTLCHSKTKDLSFYTKNADLIIVATGHRHTLTKDMIGDNMPYIIDVGINLDENGKLCGDCDTEDLKDISYITPVPKGVGLLTVATLIKRTIEIYNKRNFDLKKEFKLLKELNNNE